MGFLHESITLAYLVFPEKLLSALFLTVSFFRTYGFLFIIAGFSSSPGGAYLATLYCVIWLQKTKYRKGTFFGFLH